MVTMPPAARMAPMNAFAFGPYVGLRSSSELVPRKRWTQFGPAGSLPTADGVALGTAGLAAGTAGFACGKQQRAEPAQRPLVGTPFVHQLAWAVHFLNTERAGKGTADSAGEPRANHGPVVVGIISPSIHEANELTLRLRKTARAPAARGMRSRRAS